MPESTATASGPLPQLIAFGRDLRRRGLPVGTGRILTFVRAVSALGFADRDALYWAGRTSMIARKDDIAAYDEAFEDWWETIGAKGDLSIELTIPTAGQRPEPDWGEQPADLEITVGTTAAEWHGIGEDEEVEESDEESAIRIVASGTEVR